MTDPNSFCPKCNSADIYFDGTLWNCPACFHEWHSPKDEVASQIGDAHIRDAHGNILCEGDSVTIIKDLKVKGASSSIKVGTKVKNIRLNVDSNDGHNISCKIDGFGAMNLKSEFVKKT